MLALAALLAAAPLARASETDLAQAPLVSSAQQSVLPNLMFILDDSGSMAWGFMPDTAKNFVEDYGYASSQCNGVYYNPNVTYHPPVDSTGVAYANASFTAARSNGFDSASSTVNLGSSFKAWDNTTSDDEGDDTAQAAYYYRYTGSQTTEALRKYHDSNSTFYEECNSDIGDTPGSAVFTKVVVSSTSGPGGTDERTNFANWYSYYRTRMLLMKTAAGRAFMNIGDSFRVGFMSLNGNGSNHFLNIGQFGTTQKADWYAKLYASYANSGTPLREVLSKAGRIYAAKVSSVDGVTVSDPVQYSCQRNFALLSSDGYWNGNDGYQVDGSTEIGNQDGSDPRPYNDGASSTEVWRATLTVGGDSTTSVSSITVNGQQILPSTADSSGSGGGGKSGRLARDMSNGINECAAGLSGNCAVAGYSASRSGSVVTITAPVSVSSGWSSAPTPVVTIASGSMTVTATPFVAETVTSTGTSDTLADTAMYYYKTDLRTSALSNATNPAGTDVAVNNVLPSGDDDATWQHMTTFTLGLGARGRMVYSPTYKSDTTGDYHAVAQGSVANSATGVCSWQTNGTTCTWPVPGSDRVENIDDMWHAAVNGRGTYFSATDPASLAVGLSSALQGIVAMTSDAAAATTSNPNVTAGDNFVFSSTFRSAEWYGDLERRQIDINTGDESATVDWSVRGLLDAKAWTSRVLYTRDAAAANGLKSFAWASLDTTERGYFQTPHINGATDPLTQFCASGEICLATATQAAASGQPLVDFLRGDRSNEGVANDLGKYFRARTSVLGDIVHSEAVYVKAPMYLYNDSGYSGFVSAQASRTAMVYVAANDGMLHAFNAATGQESWAYVPALVLPKLYKIADKSYAGRHRYMVDGTPVVGDAYFGGTWHTVLVGGLGGGGRGYYALDITDPAAPRSLWEYTDTNMGYSYGKPEITKLADGTWVALLSSGYNNVSPGDGVGRLYVVNLATGALVRSISTGVGSTGTMTGCATAPCPSGLAQIRAWVDKPRYDNTALRVYGGDLYGNLWRFDINNTVGASGYDAHRLVTVENAAGTRQPITARPELGKVATYPVVFFGTGRYLGASDLTDAAGQSLYAVKDALGTTTLANPRANGSGFVQQTLSAGTCGAGSAYCAQGEAIRTGSSNTVNFGTHNGWFVDLPGTRERANADPQLALGTIVYTTNVLEASACTVGGSSYINYFDYKSGAPIPAAAGTVSISLGGALATRPVLIRLPNGNVVSLVRLSDNSLVSRRTPIAPSAAGTRRTSWREITVE